MADVVEVYSASDDREVRLLTQRLADHGVEACVPTRSAAAEFMDILDSCRIWVAAGDAQRARCLLHGWSRRASDRLRRPSWECPICTAQVDEGYQICWSCERGREEWG